MMLRMASVGDSVVWGQGLRPRDKFTHIVARELPEIVSPLSFEFAHSGGVIGGPPDAAIHARPVENAAAAFTASPVAGEIPHGLPTVIRQLRSLAEVAPSVDVIVMDGAANDAGFLGAANPTGDAFASLIDKVRFTDAPRVRFALEEARRLFPDALIFYTGYYPGLSEESDLPVEADLLQAGLTALSGFIAPVVGPVILAVESERAKRRIKRQVQQFHAELMRGVVAEIGRFNARGDAAPVFFVNPGFARKNAMYGETPFVHDTHGGFAWDVARERTDLYWDRVPKAKTIFATRADARAMIGGAPTSPGDDDYMAGWMTANAHLAHPNAAGARRYADQLKPRMAEQITFSLRQHMSAIGLPEGSLRAGMAARMNVDLAGARLRSLGGFSRLDCLEIEATTSFLSALTTHRLAFEVDWGDGWTLFDSMRGPPGETAFIDFRGERPMRTLRKLLIAYDAEATAQSRMAGRLTIRLNGTVIDNRPFRQNIRNAPDTFERRGGRRVLDLGLAAPA